MFSLRSIDEINRYTDPRYLLVVTPKSLVVYKVPFEVECVKRVQKMEEGRRYFVTLIRCTIKDQLIYKIGLRYYLYSNFRIL